MVFMGLVGGRNGNLGDFALDGDRVLGGQGAKVGPVQLNGGVADGGDVTLGYGHGGLLSCGSCSDLQLHGRL